MKGTAIACEFLIGLQLLAAYICTYKWGMHSKLLRVCCGDTTNDQVMYLRSDNTAIAMGQVKTAAARPSDNLSDPASPSNFLQIYQADTQPRAVTSGSGSKQLPTYVMSKSCRQIRALYTAMQVRIVFTVFVAESQSPRPAVLGSLHACRCVLMTCWGRKASSKVVLSPCTVADQILWGRTMQSCLVARRPDAGICLSRLLLLDIWHAHGPCMAVIPTSALSCLHTVSFVPVCSRVFIPLVALGRQINHC